MIVKNYTHDVVVKASNRLNQSTIAIEFGGNHSNEYGGVHGGRPTERRITYEQVMAGRWLLIYLKAQEPTIRTVYAHIQAHGRKNCCGPDLWYHIGEWAIMAKGWANETTSTWTHLTRSKDGKPIPPSWRRWNTNARRFSPPDNMPTPAEIAAETMRNAARCILRSW